MNPQKIQNRTILPILKYGDPLLRDKVKNVINFKILPQFVDQMFNTMYEERGIGLAANQVGKMIHLLVIDTSTSEEDNKPYIFINSKIKNTVGSIIMEEGCLSVPDIRASIERPETITLEYQDLEHNVNKKCFSGLESRVIQHELDHLEGKFFVDYLSPSKRILIHKRLLDISKNGKPSTGIIL